MAVFVFTGGIELNAKLAENLVKSFADERKFAVAADFGLVNFENFQKEFGGFEIKKIVGDFDSISDKSILEKYPREIIEQSPTDKDFSDTELALSVAKNIAQNEKIVLVGGSAGERIDHLLALFDIFATPLFADIWFCGVQTIYFLKDGFSAEISNAPKNAAISVLRTTKNRACGFAKTSGFVWESDCFRSEGAASLSNRIKGESAKIAAVGSDFLLVVPSSARVEIHSIQNQY